MADLCQKTKLILGGGRFGRFILMFSLNKIKLCSSAGLNSAYSAYFPDLPNLVWEIISFAQKNVVLAEETNAVAST